MAKKKEPSLTVQEMASMGGKARASQLTDERRAAIAKKAAAARWGKKAAKKK